ncbi:hypothetical protein FNH13_00360 [Ornithinimicrobium ciconiae]|uniref:Uncharacterized protein n=1 Tax=Ornithinimicrobium ciconiae TaxID=2594265 RepID=A0A516G619_9MICO|nr:hypothetical protein [Ornithinimicrobium ciconiae]QDO86957.1 hypothetical protein FNH13_00360 [Ornithinimicrobium ciconiae]
MGPDVPAAIRAEHVLPRVVTFLCILYLGAGLTLSWNPVTWNGWTWAVMLAVGVAGTTLVARSTPGR